MASYLELSIDQGTTFKYDIVLSDQYGEAINVANSTISSNVKKSFYSVNNTAEFTVIPIDPANGAVTLVLSHEVTSNVRAGRYYYTVNTLNNDTNERFRLIEGIVVFNPDV